MASNRGPNNLTSNATAVTMSEAANRHLLVATAASSAWPVSPSLR